uniref:Uncharacterized protein n=1 Tax=Hemiselmis andersenii TaxID=464988 RepID=A0A6T8P8B0_HEMAN|mmetsp:Transcript_35989/g.84238  ORF Transcript_35989/g.84238 Transcript_35989/m.84238 type:complete len:122 (-) Transcript_35989:27-392(-)
MPRRSKKSRAGKANSLKRKNLPSSSNSAVGLLQLLEASRHLGTTDRHPSDTLQNPGNMIASDIYASDDTPSGLTGPPSKKTKTDGGRPAYKPELTIDRSEVGVRHSHPKEEEGETGATNSE